MGLYTDLQSGNIDNSATNRSEVISKTEFVKSIIGLVESSRWMKIDDKLKIINNAAKGSQDEAREYERIFADRLQMLVESGEIKNWYPVQANTYLDDKLVDFVIVLNDGKLLPAQVTSKLKNVNKKIGRMNRIFQLSETDKRPIALFSMLVHVTRERKDEQTTLQEIREAIEATETIEPSKLH